MAVVIPESINALPNITNGEKRVFKLVKELLPNNYIAWFDLRVNGKYPDFVVLGQDLGLVVLEVKDWTLNLILSADANFYELKDIGKKINPLKQARTYMFSLVDELKKDAKLKETSDNFKGYLTFPYGYGVVFTRISRNSFMNSPFAGTIDEKHILFQDDIKSIEDAQAASQLLEKIKTMIPVKFNFAPLSQELIDRIRGNLFTEVKLSSDNNLVFKVMNIQQEQYAKGVGYGHRVVRGVAGSGKTIIIICRARYLAQIHKDWKILVLCFNKVLATFLKDSIVTNEINNVEVSHFHGWINIISKNHNLKTPVYKDKDVTENILKITDTMLGTEEKYDAVLIDEGQDLDQEWLKFIVRMLRNPEHSHLFLSSDGAQNLYNRKYTLKSIGIKAVGRTAILRENYRNTKEILNIAHNFLMDDHGLQNSDEEDNNFIINPDTSLRNGLKPLLICCKDFEDEINAITDKIVEMKQKKVISLSDISVLYPYSKSGDIEYHKIMEQLFKNKGIPFFDFSKTSRSKANLKLSDNCVKLSTIHSSKGLDFKIVFMTGLNDNLVKYGYYESKKLIYVGMTRARDYLGITYSVNNKITQSLEKAFKAINESKKASNYASINVLPQIEVAATIETYIDNDISDKKDLTNIAIESPITPESKGLFSKILSLFKK